MNRFVVSSLVVCIGCDAGRGNFEPERDPPPHARNIRSPEPTNPDDVILLVRIDNDPIHQDSYPVRAYSGHPAFECYSGLAFLVIDIKQGIFLDPGFWCITHSGVILEGRMLGYAPKDSPIELTLRWDERFNLYRLVRYRLQ